MANNTATSRSSLTVVSMVCSSVDPRFSVEDWAQCRAPHLGGMPPKRQ